jgi:hypothetical protein
VSSGHPLSCSALIKLPTVKPVYSCGIGYFLTFFVSFRFSAVASMTATMGPTTAQKANNAMTPKQAAACFILLLIG